MRSVFAVPPAILCIYFMRLAAPKDLVTWGWLMLAGFAAFCGFPILFMLYGPNTNQGCILFMLERQVDYIVRQLKRLEQEQLAWLDIKADVMQQFNQQVQKNIEAVAVWQASCGNDYYYRAGHSGRLVTQWPLSMDDFTEQTTRHEPETFEVAPRQAASAG